MAWVKIPKEHHDLLRAALPRDPRISTLNMFGGLAAMVKGNMFGGTFGRSAIARLAPDDLAEALKLDGAALADHGAQFKTSIGSSNAESSSRALLCADAGIVLV